MSSEDEGYYSIKSVHDRIFKGGPNFFSDPAPEEPFRFSEKEVRELKGCWGGSNNAPSADTQKKIDEFCQVVELVIDKHKPYEFGSRSMSVNKSVIRIAHLAQRLKAEINKASPEALSLIDSNMAKNNYLMIEEREKDEMKALCIYLKSLEAAEALGSNRFCKALEQFIKGARGPLPEPSREKYKEKIIACHLIHAYRLTFDKYPSVSKNTPFSKFTATAAKIIDQDLTIGLVVLENAMDEFRSAFEYVPPYEYGTAEFNKCHRNHFHLDPRLISASILMSERMEKIRRK